jgi:hypothetical protein
MPPEPEHDVYGNRIRQPQSRFPQPVYANVFAYSADGMLAAVAEPAEAWYGDYRITIKDRFGGSTSRELTVPPTRHLALSRNGDVLATAHDGYLLLWDTANGARLGRYRISAFGNMHFSDDVSHLLVGDGGDVMLYRLK